VGYFIFDHLLLILEASGVYIRGLLLIPGQFLFNPVPQWRPNKGTGNEHKSHKPYSSKKSFYAC